MNYYEAAVYYAVEQHGATVSDNAISFTQDSYGNVSLVQWDVLGVDAPTMAQLDTIIATVPTLNEWYDAYAKDIESQLDNWSNRKLLTLAKLIFQEINKLRAKNGDPEYTWSQFKTAFRNNM